MMKNQQTFKITFSEKPSRNFQARFYTTDSVKSAGELAKIFEREKFKAEKNTACYVADWKNGTRILAVGLGEEKLIVIETFRQAAGLSVKSARGRKAQEISI